MGAVGNYEVVTEELGPFVGAELGYVRQTGAIPLPAGKRVLGISFTLEPHPSEERARAQAWSSVDGTEVEWDLLLSESDPDPTNFTVYITCAEMGC